MTHFRSNTLRRLLLVSSAVALGAPGTALAKPKAKPPEAAPFAIAAIEAKLFYDGTATFSRNLLAEPPFRFWNTVIGEGEAEGPSNATFVVVQIAGNPSEDVLGPQRSIDLLVRSEGRTVFKKSQQIGLFKDGRFYAGFWLYDTGCMPLQLTAKIRGQRQKAESKAEIPFACGE